MRLLLDTSVVLWWLRDDPRLGAHPRNLLADRAHDLLVSDVSLWEIVVKIRIGKLRGDVRVIADACAEAGFRRLALSLPHLERLATLPTLHRDPFDHLLLAQALAEEATFVTSDGALQRYPVEILRC